MQGGASPLTPSHVAHGDKFWHASQSAERLRLFSTVFDVMQKIRYPHFALRAQCSLAWDEVQGQTRALEGVASLLCQAPRSQYAGATCPVKGCPTASRYACPLTAQLAPSTSLAFRVPHGLLITPATGGRLDYPHPAELSNSSQPCGLATLPTELTGARLRRATLKRAPRRSFDFSPSGGDSATAGEKKSKRE